MTKTPNLPLAFLEVLGAAWLLMNGSKAVGKTFNKGDTAAITTETAAPSTGSVGTGAKQGDINFGDLHAANSYRWSGGDLIAWWHLIAGESGGKSTARNASSGAFGIGQFLGGTLTAYAPYGATSTSPIAQLHAMAKYIHDRYGTPTNAYRQWLARSPHWY